LIWLNDVIKGEDIAYVAATRTGQGGISGSDDVSETRKFVIDFVGKNLGSDFSQKGITPNVSAISGKIINVSAIYNPITKGITVYADYAPHSDNDEIRISLEQNGKTISEVWSYQWLK
jgi:glucans biosynthesis protein